MEKVNINGKDIVLSGVGKKFYQNGYPISMSIEQLSERNISVSMLHVADELLKHGWSPKTVISKLKEEMLMDINHVMSMEGIEEFCNSTYEHQREMIFKSLFESEDQAKEHLKILMNEARGN